MRRFARIAVPVCVLASAFAGAAQQGKHPAAAKPAGGTEEPGTPSPRLQAIRANNIGLALMDRQDFQNALGKFQIACVMDSQSDAGCLNMGIAFLYMQRYDDARRVLAKSASKDAKNPRAWFNLGLVERAVDQPKAALEDFEKTARSIRTMPTRSISSAIFYRKANSMRKPAAYLNAVKLNPFHASAELGLRRSRSIPVIRMPRWRI